MNIKRGMMSAGIIFVIIGLLLFSFVQQHHYGALCIMWGIYFAIMSIMDEQKLTVTAQQRERTRDGSIKYSRKQISLFHSPFFYMPLIVGCVIAAFV